MSVKLETNAELELTGVKHRVHGLRYPSLPTTPLQDQAVVLEITLGGALLDEVDRLALARWLLVGTPYEVRFDYYDFGRTP